MTERAEATIGLKRSASSALERAGSFIRRNPVPVVLIATGIGWLAASMGKKRARTSASRIERDAEEIPVLNTGQAHVYDPDVSPLHPAQVLLDPGPRESVAPV